MLVFLAIQLPSVSAQTKYLTYTNTNVGFTIKYPSDWTVNDTNTNNIIFNKVGQVDVLVSKVQHSNVSLADGIKKTLAGMEPKGFRLTELNNNAYLAGHQAIRITGIHHYGGGGEPTSTSGVQPHDVKIMSSSIKSGMDVYIVSYISSPDTYFTYLPIVNQMLDSFQVIEAK